MIKVEVLKPFIGSMEESLKYGHPSTRVIPHRHIDRSGNACHRNVIETTPERVKELQALGIVRPYTPPAPTTSAQPVDAIPAGDHADRPRQQAKSYR